jgi:hypothetical protein
VVAFRRGALICNDRENGENKTTVLLHFMSFVFGVIQLKIELNTASDEQRQQQQ